MTLSLVEVALLVWGLAWMTLAIWVALLRYSPPVVEPSPGSAVGLFEGGRPLPDDLPRFVRMPRQARTGLASESWEPGARKTHWRGRRRPGRGDW
jgi:hypothetical protein